MGDRTLARYEEPRNEEGPHWSLEIDRSAAGAPGLLFTIHNDPFEGSPLKAEQMTVVVEDGRSLLAPVNAWLEGRAPVITLCGSSRFKDAINAENARLTREGNVVISLGMFGHADFPSDDWSTDGTALKTRLDRLHFQKIAMADRVHVINPGGYIGESTAREIEYAKSLHKAISYLEPQA